MGKNVLGSALAEVAGPLKDLAEKLGGEGGEQWLAALKRFLRKEEAWPKFPVWKTIELGEGLKAADDFRRLLKKAECQISGWADDIMNKSALAESLAGADPEEEYDLVLLTTAQLTGRKGGTISEVFAGAERLGFRKCPTWMGPKLRSKYLDQPNGEWILIGMDPITVSVGYPCVFYVERDDSGLWLSCYWSYPAYVWHPDFQWVFRLPRK